MRKRLRSLILSVCVFLPSEALVQSHTGTYEQRPSEAPLRVYSEKGSEDSALPLIVKEVESIAEAETLVLGVVDETINADSSNTAEFLTLTRRMSSEIGLNLTRGVLSPNLSLENDPVVAVPEKNSLHENLGTRYESSTAADADLAKDDETGLELRLNSFIGVDSSCLDSKDFDFVSWADERPFSKQVSELRRNLYFEFDQIDPIVQLSLVRLYLHFGFGAEAGQRANLNRQSSASFSIAVLLSELLEYGSTAATVALARYSTCDGPVGLWATLATLDDELLSGDNLNSALRELYRLPEHLQRTVAPHLADKFTRSGYYDEANMALRVLYRGSDPLDRSAQFQQAELLAAVGDSVAAEQMLLEISGTNSAEAARALVRYIDMIADEGGSLSKTIVEMAEVYSVELRESEIGPRLARAHILALAKSGDFEGAYEVMQNAIKLKIDAPNQFSKLFDILTREASDFEFTKRTISANPQEVSSLPSTTKYRIAVRLNELGFDEQAAEFLLTIPSSVFPKDQRLLRAKVALGLERYSEAIDFVRNTNELDARIILAEAYEELGEVKEAYQIYFELGMYDEAEKVIWRSSQSFPTNFQGSHASEKLIKLASENQPQVLVGQLAQTQELITNSQRLASEISDLLGLPELKN